MYTLIENFCLGTRRLELFGRPHCLKRGWVTVGEFDPSDESLREKGASFWDKDQWQAKSRAVETGKALVPSTPGV
jgi:mRNA (2'-O-methyladenosine-N6-)-methyltransferase